MHTSNRLVIFVEVIVAGDEHKCASDDTSDDDDADDDPLWSTHPADTANKPSPEQPRPSHISTKRGRGILLPTPDNAPCPIMAMSGDTASALANTSNVTMSISNVTKPRRLVIGTIL